MSGRWRTLALVLVTLGVLAWALTQFRPAGPQNPLTNPASVERELLADEPGGALSRTIKRTFPEDFEALKATVVERARAGEGPTEVRETAGAFVSLATQRHRASLAQAPVKELRAYLAAEIALAEQLAATSQERCAAYFADPTNDAAWYAPDLRGLYLKQNIALWEAAAAARDHPAGRTLAVVEPNPTPNPATCAGGLAELRSTAAQPAAAFEYSYPLMLSTIR